MRTIRFDIRWMIEFYFLILTETVKTIPGTLRHEDGSANDDVSEKLALRTLSKNFERYDEKLETKQVASLLQDLCTWKSAAQK